MLSDVTMWRVIAGTRAHKLTQFSSVVWIQLIFFHFLLIWLICYDQLSSYPSADYVMTFLFILFGVKRAREWSAWVHELRRTVVEWSCGTKRFLSHNLIGVISRTKRTNDLISGSFFMWHCWETFWRISDSRLLEIE